MFNGKMGQQAGSAWRISRKATQLKLLIANGLIDASDFVWGYPHVLKKRSRSIADVTKCYHKRAHKFGIEVPKSWDDCANTIWQDSVMKEIKNIRIAFKIMNGE
jgi:hypothetical protein